MSRKYAPGEQPIVDRWTVGHAAVGVVYGGATSWPWWVALAAGVAWEVVENPLKDTYPWLFPDVKHDRTPNAIADTAAVMVGFWVGRRLRNRHRLRT